MLLNIFTVSGLRYVDQFRYKNDSTKELGRSYLNILHMTNLVIVVPKNIGRWFRWIHNDTCYIYRRATLDVQVWSTHYLTRRLCKTKCTITGYNSIPNPKHLFNFFFCNSPMTFSWIKWLTCGVVETWHSYIPESLCCGYLICNIQSPKCGWWIALNRWSDVYVYRPTVSRWISRCRIQDTCNNICRFNLRCL